jgi:hypothetical protein
MYRPFFADLSSIENVPCANGDTIFLLGSNLHEAGWVKCIELDLEGKMVVAEDDFGVQKGDRVEFRTLGGETFLLITDARTGAPKDLLKKFDGDLHQRVINNFFQYIFAGTFRNMDGNGETVVFNAKKSTVSGLISKGETPFTFIEAYGDIPIPSLRFGNDMAYKVNKKLIGIELVPLQPNDDNWEWNIEEDTSKPTIFLVKTAEGESGLPPGRFPLVSKKVMTLPELELYAGEPKLQSLQDMRNEVIARYGYIFDVGSEEADFFGTQDWYWPTQEDVTSQLTEVEQINTALIRLLEKRLKGYAPELTKEDINVGSTLKDLVKVFPKYKIKRYDMDYDGTVFDAFSSVEALLKNWKRWYAADRWTIFVPLEANGQESNVGYFLWLGSPDESDDFERDSQIWMIQANVPPSYPADPNNLPFTLLHPSLFDKDAFDENSNYWSYKLMVEHNGNVTIMASPAMSWSCVMLARYNGKNNYTLYKRAGYDFMNIEITDDNAETEKYLRNVIQPNIDRINAMVNWEYIENKHPLVLEGGADILFYYSRSGLEKMVTTFERYATTQHIEYYFLDGRLSFIHNITTKNDNNVKTERRWYLRGDSCFRGIGDNGKKLTYSEMEEEFLGERDVFWLYTVLLEGLGEYDVVKELTYP